MITENNNKLDKQITKIMTHAEKKCMSLASHHLDSWSPELVEAFKTKSYWKTKVTAASKMPYYMGLVEAIENFRHALDKYDEAEKYKELKLLAKEQGTDTGNDIKSLIEIEKSRSQNKRINRVIKPRSGGWSSSILILSITEYQQPYPKGFDFMDIKHIWNMIEFDNGEDIKNRDRITDQKGVQSMLRKWQRCHFT